MFWIHCLLIFLLQTALKSFNTRSFPCRLSDHHNLVVTVLKNTFGKQKFNTRYYRDWGKLDNAVFKTEVRKALIRVERHDYKCFVQAFLSLLNPHSPMKSKKQRANDKSYMTKTLCKAILKRSEIAPKYHKTKDTKDFNNFKKQKNFC